MSLRRWRLLASLALVVELCFIVPRALDMISVERHDLDVGSRLPGLLDALLLQEEEDSTTTPNEFEFSSTIHINMMLLIGGDGDGDNRCGDLNEWSRTVHAVDAYLRHDLLRGGGGEAEVVSLAVESTVMFNANTDLLVRSQARALFQVLDDGLSVSKDNAIHLALVCPGNSNTTGDAPAMFHVPGWGVVLVSSGDSPLHAFSTYLATAVLPRNVVLHAKRDIVRKLAATKTLADSLPYLPIGRDVCQVPFELALDLLLLVETTEESNVVVSVLPKLQRAVQLANSISTHPSLIPSLYMSNQNLFAVFAPMVMPTLMPIVLGLAHELRLAGKRRRAQPYHFL